MSFFAEAVVAVASCVSFASEGALASVVDSPVEETTGADAHAAISRQSTITIDTTINAFFFIISSLFSGPYGTIRNFDKELSFFLGK